MKESVSSKIIAPTQRVALEKNIRDRLYMLDLHHLDDAYKQYFPLDASLDEKIAIVEIASLHALSRNKFLSKVATILQEVGLRSKTQLVPTDRLKTLITYANTLHEATINDIQNEHGASHISRRSQRTKSSIANTRR